MDELPAEIWEKIFSSTDQKSRFALRGTCIRLLNRFTSNNFVFYFTRSNRLPDIARRLSRYDTPISVKFTKTVELIPEAINHLSTLTNITNLSFDTDYSVKKAKSISQLKRLTNLHSLNFGNRPSTRELIYSDYSHIYMNPFNQLTTLTLRNRSVQNIDALKQKKNLLDLDVAYLEDFAQIPCLSRLTSLKVSHFAGLHAQTAMALTQARNLKFLTAEAYYDNAHPIEGGVFQFPFEPLTELQSLRLMSFSNPDIKYCVGLTKLVLDSVSLAKARTHDWTSLTNLKTLDFSPRMMFYAANVENTDYHFLTALSNLEEYSSLLRQDSYYWKFLTDKLTSLRINILPPNDLAHLTRFTNLQQFQLTSADFIAIDFHFLTKMEQLTQLDVSVSAGQLQHKNLAECLKHLMKLKELSLKTEPTREIFDFSYLPNLESLVTQSVDAESFESLKGLSKLTRITISDWFPNVLEHLPLKVLTSYGRSDTLDIIAILQKTTALESLALILSNSGKGNNHFNDKLIRSLTSLQHLTELKFYGSHEFSYKSIAKLTNLQRLVSNEIKKSEFKKLQKKMPFLHSLSNTMF